MQFIQPVKPVQNSFIERFSGTMHNECLKGHGVLYLGDARDLIES